MTSTPAPAPGTYALCHRDEFEDKPSMEFRLGEGEWPLRIFVIKDGKNWYAYKNTCPHAGMPLNWSPDVFLTPDMALIQCQAHGALFEKHSGACVGGPCMGQSLAAYPVTINEAGMVRVEIV